MLDIYIQQLAKLRPWLLLRKLKKLFIFIRSELIRSRSAAKGKVWLSQGHEGEQNLKGFFSA